MRFTFRSPKLRGLRALVARLPPLTPLEKTAVVALAAVLAGGAALRAWERAGVSLGPVRDWETLRTLVIRARADLAQAGGDTTYACAEGPEDGSEWGRGGARAELITAGGPSHSKSGGSAKKLPPARPVDLNAAGEKALLALPGVGPSTAKAIVAHRASQGPFRSVEDLLQVKGIGPKKLEALRPHVQVRQVRDRAGGRSGDSTGTPSEAGPAGTPPNSP